MIHRQAFLVGTDWHHGTYDDATGVFTRERIEANGLPNPQAPAATQARKCCGAEIIVWLGLRWYGKPWPKRLHLFPPHIEREVGCGCLVKLKALMDGLKHAWRSALRA